MVFPQLEPFSHELVPPHIQGMHYGFQLQIMSTSSIVIFMLLQLP
jgi:hypothetical protein